MRISMAPGKRWAAVVAALSTLACAGVALGLAGGLKFFLWPLGIWLLATRRYRAAAVAAVLAVSSVLLVELFASVGAYLETLDEVRRTFDQDAYSIFGLMTRLGGSESAAHAATFALGGGLLVLTWRSGSFALAVAAALVLSPIVPHICDAIYADLGKREGVTLVPFWLESIYQRPELFQADRLHPTTEGLGVLVGATKDAVKEALPPAD